MNEFQKSFVAMAKELGFGPGMSGGELYDAVAYGSPALRRPSRFAWLKTPVILASMALVYPAIILDWLLCPLYIVPLHEMGWGAPDMTSAGLPPAIAILHSLALFLAALPPMVTIIVRYGDGYWWWNGKPKSD